MPSPLTSPSPLTACPLAAHSPLPVLPLPFVTNNSPHMHCPPPLTALIAGPSTARSPTSPHPSFPHKHLTARALPIGVPPPPLTARSLHAHGQVTAVSCLASPCRLPSQMATPCALPFRNVPPTARPPTCPPLPFPSLPTQLPPRMHACIHMCTALSLDLPPLALTACSLTARSLAQGACLAFPCRLTTCSLPFPRQPAPLHPLHCPLRKRLFRMHCPSRKGPLLPPALDALKITAPYPYLPSCSLRGYYI